MADLCQRLDGKLSDVGWDDGKVVSGLQHASLRSKRSRPGQTVGSLDFGSQADDHLQSSIPLKPCTLQQLAADIAALIGHFGITHLAAIVGVAQGGATALAFAKLYPTLCDNLIVCDTSIKAPDGNEQAWNDRIAYARQHGMAALAELTLPRWYPKRSQLVHGAQEQIVRTMMASTSIDGLAAAAASLQNYDLTDGLVRALSSKRVLLIAGEYDSNRSAELNGFAHDINEAGGTATFVEIPAAGHVPVFLYNGLEEILVAMGSFLSE